MRILGTFSSNDLEELLDFATSLLPQRQDQINYLRTRIKQIGWIMYEVDDSNNAIGYSIVPTDSIMASLVIRYQAHGGNVLDLEIKSRGQWISWSQNAPELDSTKEDPSGTLLGTQDTESNLHRDDAVPGLIVDKVQSYIRPTYKSKRLEHEFRIKRMIDLLDQYLIRIIQLVRINAGPESLESLSAKLRYLVSQPEFPSAGR